MKAYLLAGIATLPLAMPAIAQTSNASGTAGQPVTSAAPTETIGDIVVTARKTEEKLQTVPLTVTALGGLALKQQTIQTTNDVQFHVPGLIQAPEPQGGQPDFSIRGTRQQGATGSQGGVAVYLDYVPLQSTNSIAYSTYDMQSIQVLKGPQGTLFGKNTTGGAIIFSPNKPTHSFEGFLTGGYGDYNRKELTGMINVPLGDTLALRVSGSYVHRDGYVKNIAPGFPDLDDERHESGRAILRWTPNSAFTNDVIADYTHLHNNPAPNIGVAVSPFCSAFYSNCASALAQGTLGTRTVNFPEQQYAKSRNYGVSDAATYELGSLTVRNVFSYRWDDYHGLNDIDGIANLPLISGADNTNGHALTDEIDFIGKLFDNKLDYTVGLYYSDSYFQQQYVYNILPVSFDGNGNYIGGLPSYYQVGPSVANNIYKTMQKAIYGQVNYHVDDKFTATIGARYTDETQKASSQLFTGTVSPTNNAPACATAANFSTDPGLDAANCTVHVGQSFHPITWNFSLNYQATRGTLIYATASRGNQSGGFNFQVPLPQYQRFKPETVQSFETGIKSDWHLGDRPIRTNLAAYYSKYQDQQRVINDSLPNGQAIIGTFNAANSTIYGVEAEINYLPTRDLELSAFYSFIHARYDQFITPTVFVDGGKDLSGAQISSTPKHTLGGTAAYTVHLGGDGKARFSATGYYRSGTYVNDIVQTQYTLVKGYALLNARIDLLKALPVDVAVYMNNVTNKTYKLFGFDNLNSLGYASANYGAPRTYGIEATYKF